jgi:hypothetical protein
VDQEKAINRFVEHVEDLPNLPLVTDLEMKELYGEEVATALEKMNRLIWEKQLCLQCDSICCQEYGCEFYAPQFGQCPIFDLRPIVCRFHFCEKFQVVGGSTIKELSEIFLYSIHAAGRCGSTRGRFFDPPPLGKVAPQLVESISPWVNAVRTGRLNHRDGRKRVREQVTQYCTTHACSEGIEKVKGQE